MHRVRGFVAICVVAVSVAVAAAPDDALDAAAILERVRAGWQGESFHAMVELETTLSGVTSRYLMEVWTLGEDRALLRIREPVADAGSGYLHVGDDLWYYSPSVGIAIPLPAMGLTQALFGAGPSLGDLARGTLSGDYDARAETITGPTGGRLYLLALVPRPAAPVVYGKIEVKVTADYVLAEIVYYDHRGRIIRRATLGKAVLLGDRLFPTEIVIVDANGDRVVQRILNPERDIGIDASFFTVARLEAGK